MILKPRWDWLAWIVLPIAIMAVLYGLMASLPNPPQYQAKPFYQWAGELRQAENDYSDPARQDKIATASNAIRAIGTNGLPLVMADLRAHSTLKDSLIAWLARWAPFLKLKPVNVADRWSRGIQALEVLGPLGKPYLPEIISMVTNSTGYAEGALMAIGPDALPAFTNLLAHSKFPQTGNLISYFANAVYANRITPGQASVALPYLVLVFNSSDSHGRWYAASALARIFHNRLLFRSRDGFFGSKPGQVLVFIWNWGRKILLSINKCVSVHTAPVLVQRRCQMALLTGCRSQAHQSTMAKCEDFS